MYKITDNVEMGHSPLIGGTIEISIELDKIPSKEKTKEILTVMDYLDHCLVTNNKEMIKFSKRHFLLDKSVSLFEDVQTILYYFLKENYVCTVSIGKESFTEKLAPHSKILEYNHKG